MASRFEVGQPARRTDWADDRPSVDVVWVDDEAGVMRVRERAGGQEYTAWQREYKPVDGRFLPKDHPDYMPSPWESMRIGVELEQQERELQRQATYQHEYGLLSVSATLYSVLKKTASLGMETISRKGGNPVVIGNYLRYEPVVVGGRAKFKRRDALLILKRLLDGDGRDEIERQLFPEYGAGGPREGQGKSGDSP